MPGRACWSAILLVVGVAACGSREEPPAPTAPPSTTAAAPIAPPPAAASPVVARVDGRPITAAELDASMPLALHDLDRARFELRRVRLRDLLVSRVLGPRAVAEGISIDAYVRRYAADDAGAAAFVDDALARANVEVLLDEPEPPLVAVSVDADPVRGRADAPVTVVEFVDFQSPYCRAMQPVLQRLLARYPDHVRLVVRDLPLPVHRHAATAAEAAACAADQQAYWPYHDVLLQEQDRLDRDALVRYAERLRLDVARFVDCLDTRRHRADVDADAAAARRIGATVVPTFFVNGRYLRGPQSYETLAARVEAELARLGLPVPPPPASSTPSPPSAAPASAPPPDQAPALPTSSLTLSRAAVDKALRRRRRLVRALDLPALDDGAGGTQRLMRVRRVRTGDLYDQLGLRPGDVVMTVDGRLVLDDTNALLDALRAQSTVTVQILRGGLPQTLDYAIR